MFLFELVLSDIYREKIFEHLTVEDVIRLREALNSKRLDYQFFFKDSKGITFKIPYIDEEIEKIYRLVSEYSVKELLKSTFKTGDCKLLRNLLKIGPEIWEHELLLIDAVDAESVASVKILLEFGEDPNSLRCDIHGERTPLTIATYRGNFEIFKLLIDAGAEIYVEDLECFAFVDAIEHGRYEFVETFLDIGINIENTDVPEDEKEKGYTPLMIGIQCCHLSIVKLLVDRGADIFAKNYSGRSVLYIADKRGTPEIIQLISGECEKRSPGYVESERKFQLTQKIPEPQSKSPPKPPPRLLIRPPPGTWEIFEDYFIGDPAESSEESSEEYFEYNGRRYDISMYSDFIHHIAQGLEFNPFNEPVPTP